MNRDAQLIAELRELIAGEIPLTLHLFPGKQPGHGKRDPDPSYGTITGLPFTNPFARYLGHYDGWGSTRPGSRAILEVDEWCRAKHPTHERSNGYWLCAILLIRVCYWRRDLSDDRLAPILSKAIRHAAGVWRAKKPEKLDEPLPYTRVVSDSARRGRQRRYNPPDGQSHKGIRVASR